MSKSSKHPSSFRSGPYLTDEQKAAQLIVLAVRFVDERDLVTALGRIVRELIGNDEDR